MFRTRQRSNRTGITRAVAFAVMVLVGQGALAQPDSRERLLRAMAQAMKNSPAVTEYVRRYRSSDKGETQIFAETQPLAARGVLRLGADHMRRRTALLSAVLDRADVQTCAKVLHGGMTPSDTERLMAVATDEELLEMARISVAGMDRELAGSPAARSVPDRDRVQQVFESLARRFPDEYERVVIPVSAKDATDRDRCAQTRYLFHAATKLTGDDLLDFGFFLTSQ